MMPPLALLLLAGAVPVTAQHAEAEDPDSAHRSHGRTFSTGPREGWTFSSPHLDVAGGLYREPNHAPVVSEAFFRLHVQAAVGPKFLELAADLLWLPDLGGTPTFSAALQFAPVAETSPFYLAAGGGVISGRSSVGDRLSGWLQAEVAWRTPIHELTPFVSVGRALVDGGELELLVGIAHPLAPYRMHIP
jgi:hypothetical protein